MILKITITDENDQILELATAESRHGSRVVYDYLDKATLQRQGFELLGAKDNLVEEEEEEEVPRCSGCGAELDEDILPHCRICDS